MDSWLDEAMSQASFGTLVGVGQSTVSELLARGVLEPGGTARAWLTAYCDHLRAVAMDRDPDGRLLAERTRLAKERADALKVENTRRRALFAPVPLLDAVLAHVGSAVADQLTATARRLGASTGDLPAPAAGIVVGELMHCAELARGVKLADADRLEASGDAEHDDSGADCDD